MKNPISKDPYSKVNSPTPIAPIEKDKKKKDECGEDNIVYEDTESTKSFIYGTLLSFINEILKNSTKKPEISSKKLRINLKKTCDTLIELFSNLMQHDNSHNSKFSYELSITWQQLYQINTELSQFATYKKTTKEKIDTLITSVHSYPNHEEFSLGYYLSEGSGETWTPFPLLKILQKLHLLAQDGSHSNPLSDWIDQLHDIINAISSDIE